MIDLEDRLYNLVVRYVGERFPDLDPEARQKQIDAYCISFLRV